MRWVRCAAYVAALSCIATMCCGAARVREAGEKTAGPSTFPSTPLRLAQGRSGSAQDDRSIGGRRATKKAVALTPWEQAERGRETLEAISDETRTRADYTQAMDAYRAIYHTDPADVHASAAVNAVAELLAEQGRTLHDEKSLRAAVGQYEFLRTQYPASSLGVQALLAEGQIAQNDLKDAATARERYKLLLKEHGRSEQAEEARAGLASLVQGTGNRDQGTVKTGQSVAAGIHVSVARPSDKLSAGSGAPISVVDQPTHPTQPAKVAAIPAHGDAATNGATNGVRSAKSGVSSLPAMAQTSGAVANGAAQQRLGTAQPTHPTPPAKMAGTPVREPTATSGADSVAGAVAGGEARSGKPALVTGIRHWSTATYTRVAIDLGDNVTYEAARVPNPDRIYFDLHGTRLAPELVGKSFAVTDDGFLKKVRAAQYSDDVTRVVLDVNDVTEYSAFLLPNPYRLIIDIHGGTGNRGQGTGDREQGTANKDDTIVLAAGEAPAPRAAVTVKPTVARPVPNSVATKSATAASEVADLSQLPGRVDATSKPTSKPISAVVETGNREQGTGNRNGGDSVGTSAAGTNAADVSPTDAGADTSASSGKKTRRGKAKAAGGSNSAAATVADATPARAAVPTADGETSLVRALGLKIGRIVIDPGHGGHDSGTLGVDGIEEKDVVLDVALRLGRLLHDRLGTEIIYTRSDDTFVPLETRTAIANKAQADLFLSIHANSSPEASARGVETYYLNFTSDPTALDVAARENAVSDQSIHQLSDLVKKIALKDKIAESREFAGDVEGSLYAGLQKGNAGLKDRGVKKAPFVVLIGANMPSILAEISFVTNPKDAEQLRDPEYRERVAESLYKGVARYEGGLSGARVPTERAAVGQ
jgi:N-acetylmuramoyl-L-alanine amidase